METKKAIKKKAIQHLSSDKASGVDAIPVMIYNAGGLPMAKKLTDLFQCMWMMAAITHEFNDAFIIYENGKQILKSVTTEASLSYQLLVRYWQKFNMFALMCI